MDEYNALDELLGMNMADYQAVIDSFQHVPQMTPQGHASNTLADTGRYPEHMEGGF